MAAERRSCPRYPLDCIVMVAAPPAGEFEAVAINISLVSMQIGCNAALVSALQKQPRLPYNCRLQFVLEDCAFDVDAQLITWRRLSHEKYVLALRLRHADDSRQALLESRIGQLASRMAGDSGRPQ